MKAIFVHDHNFVINKNDGLIYDGSGGAFDSMLWKRYLDVFDNLIIIGRKKNSLPNQLVVSSAEHVEFNLIEGAHGFKDILVNHRRIKKELQGSLSEVDFAIIRLPSTLGGWCLKLCKNMGLPYIVEVVGDPYEAYWFHGSVLGKIIAPIQSFKMKRQVLNSKFVIYVTKEKLQNKYPTKYYSESISNVRLMSLISKEKVKGFYLKSRSKFIIGFIGTFHVKYKGHYEAIKALSVLREKGVENIILRLVGSGDSGWVLDLAKKFDVLENVEIVGVLQAGDKGIVPFLDTLDLYIHPSLTEGLPRVVIEAMSRARVCLVSNAGGTGELVKKDFIHEPKDYRKLASDILNILNISEDERLEIALANLERSEKYLETFLQIKRKQFFNKALRFHENFNCNI